MEMSVNGGATVITSFRVPFHCIVHSQAEAKVFLTDAFLVYSLRARFNGLIKTKEIYISVY